MYLQILVTLTDDNAGW